LQSDKIALKKCKYGNRHFEKDLKLIALKMNFKNILKQSPDNALQYPGFSIFSVSGRISYS